MGGIDGPCGVGGVACVMRETLTRQRVTARIGGLDQKALRDLTVSSEFSRMRLSSRTLGRSTQVRCGRRSGVGAKNVADETLEFD